MSTHHPDNTTSRPADADTRITHVIPAVELTGSREQCLRTLDTLIDYLQRMRRTLAGATDVAASTPERPSRYLHAPDWPWIAGGIAVVALLLALTMMAYDFFTNS